MNTTRFFACAMVVAASLTPTALLAQENVDLAMIERIKREGMDSSSQALAIFNHLTNVTGARLTGSPQHKQAADWSRDRLESWGMTNARLEPFEFGGGWTLDHLTVEMTKPRYFPLRVGQASKWSGEH